MSKAATKKEPVGSAFDLLGKSYEIVKKNWEAFAVVNILGIVGAIVAAFGNTKDNIEKEEWWKQTFNDGLQGLSGIQITTLLGVGGTLLILLTIAGLFLYVMSVCLEVKASAGKKPTVSELFEDGKKYFFRVVGVSILSGLIFLGGLILLVIPGIFALGRLAMSPYHLVDKNLGVVDALKASNDQAKGKMMLVYAAIGVMILISIGAGIIDKIPVLGPLASIAIVIAFSLILALRYQQLKALKK